MDQDHTHQVIEEVGRRLDRGSSRSLYWQTSELLEKRIAACDLRPGDRIPSQRQLSKLWGISEVTVRRAMQELAARGLIRSKAGSGTLVIGRDVSAESSTALTTQTIRSVGIVFAGLSDGYPFIRPMIEGIERRCNGEVTLQLFDMTTLLAADPGAAKSVSFAQVDALLLESPVSLPLVIKCQEQGVPYVLQFSDLADGHSRCVVSNYTTGVLQAVGHLVNERNRRDIALVTANHQRFSTGKLLDAFGVASMVYGLNTNEQWITSEGYEESDGYKATKRLLAMPHAPNAILFASDYQARGGLIAAQEMGVYVPGDLSIIGTGNLLREREWPVPLSTIDLAFDDIGFTSMDLLYAMVNHEADVPMRRSVSSRFIPGKTS
jgi:LacI family transcriptional regulator